MTRCVVPSNGTSCTNCAQHKTRADRAEKTVERIKLIRVWTNEDGKQFIFADDLQTMLEEEGFWP